MADSLSSSHPLVWIDCEMTGLDLDNDVIIEIFCVITNGNLDVLDEEGWGAVIHQSKETMDKMPYPSLPLEILVDRTELTEPARHTQQDEWCTKTHGASGLTAAVIASSTTAEQASTALLSYIKRFVPEPKRALLAGNTVHADKAFLRKAPYTQVHDHFSHRILDVSSLKEAAKRWCGLDVLVGVPKKMLLHQAKADILESIEEARYYKETIFQRPRGGK
ncbi:Oligoribonuclease, mitochondrial [Lachnellula willkommii]|uniref:Oligoribonuclease, mitochondrial n=1 Tax=Lachnellula willkommii TaxID=215461 RepID=A0A559M5P9_9HELO|nr:Oligoribonuclease, mitochondrial [Lachnellula willkommii]